MIKLTTKQYEVEEKILVDDDKGNVIYEFDMQLTPAEVGTLRDIILDKEQIKIAKEQQKLQRQNKIEEIEELEEKSDKRAEENQVKFEEICFKEHLKPIKEKIGEFKFEELSGQIFDFFWKAFMTEKGKRINMMTTDLRKITNS